MTDPRIAEVLRASNDEVLGRIPSMIPGMSTGDIFGLLEAIEDNEIFKGRLALRLRLYAEIAQSDVAPELKLISLLRLLRRLGPRRDVPSLGEIPGNSDDFPSYLAKRAHELSSDEYLAEAIAALGQATLDFRTGDLNALKISTSRGLEALGRIDEWVNPPSAGTLRSILVSETGHEIMFLAVNAAFRGGDVAYARDIADEWSGKIEGWEGILGPLQRQRYQYYQLAGHLMSETGLFEDAIEAYKKALDYAPTPYRKSFIWLSMALCERNIGLTDNAWNHASMAVEALLDSPYPQAAARWIEWLALESTETKQDETLDRYRRKLASTGAVETNRVTRAMTDLYRMLRSLRTGSDPSLLAPGLENLADELIAVESWSNVVTILATCAVVAGRLDDRGKVDEIISHARSVIGEHISVEARPRMEFILEHAHALALRDVCAYEEAFRAMFEGALEARMKYPGGIGPDEETTIEALYYLGALAGYDPDAIERKIRDTI